MGINLFDLCQIEKMGWLQILLREKNRLVMKPQNEENIQRKEMS